MTNARREFVLHSLNEVRRNVKPPAANMLFTARYQSVHSSYDTIHVGAYHTAVNVSSALESRQMAFDAILTCAQWSAKAESEEESIRRI